MQAGKVLRRKGSGALQDIYETVAHESSPNKAAGRGEIERAR